MELLKILGLPLQEGIDLIKKFDDSMKIETKETYSTKRDTNYELIEPRILRVSNTDSVITIVVGYF